MTQLDTAGADVQGIARASAHLTIALIDLLIEKRLLTTNEVATAVAIVCERLETGSGVGDQGAARLLRQSLGA